MIYQATYSHAEPVVQSVPVPIAHAAVFTLQQTVGTGRAFDWNVTSQDRDGADPGLRGTTTAPDPQLDRRRRRSRSCRSGT